VPKVLARGIAAMTLVAALVAAGPAVAEEATPTGFSAPFANGGTIAFELVEKRRLSKVREIELKDVAANCEGNAGQLSFSIYGATPVLADRSFAVRSESEGGGKAVVRGRFSRRFTRAKGRARLHGRFEFQEGWSSCESGKQRFKAAEIVSRVQP
jgi:hypothetical protein